MSYLKLLVIALASSLAFSASVVAYAEGAPKKKTSLTLVSKKKMSRTVEQQPAKLVVKVKGKQRSKRKILLQKRSQGKWKTIRKKRSNRKGIAKAAVSPNRVGVHVYRWRVKATKKSRGAVSKKISIHVKKAKPRSNATTRPILHGVSTGNVDPVKHENALGGRLALHRTFWNDKKTEKALSRAARDHEAGRIPFMSFKLSHSWEEMASGAGDAWAKDLASKLDKLDGEVWIVLHHEPEKDQPNILAWTEMQRRLAPIFAAKDNIKFGLILTGYHQVATDVTNGEFALERIYPKGAPIDFLGFDVYQQYKSAIGGGRESNPSRYYGPLSKFARSVGVDWGLAEYGITDEAWSEPRFRDYFTTLERDLKTYGASFASYFDYPAAMSSWNLHGSKLDAWVKFVRATSGTQAY